MWLFRGLTIGFYHPFLFIFHAPLWCTGYLIRDKAKFPLAQWVWIGIFTTTILLGEVACTYWLKRNDGWIPMILLTMLLDLMIGYFSKGFYRIIRGAFKALIDWIKKDETEPGAT